MPGTGHKPTFPVCGNTALPFLLTTNVAANPRPSESSEDDMQDANNDGQAKQADESERRRLQLDSGPLHVSDNITQTLAACTARSVLVKKLLQLNVFLV